MKDENFQVQVKEINEGLKLIFNGQLTIAHIQKIKEDVGEKVDFKKDLFIEVDNPENLDITFLQLLQSMKTTAEAHKRQFSVSATLPNELESLVSNAGFSDLLNSNSVNN
jgi:anti-anti-sigma regulatory factor